MATPTASAPSTDAATSAAAPSSNIATVANKTVVKLLKPDGAGHMQRIFTKYALKAGRNGRGRGYYGVRHYQKCSTAPAALDYVGFQELLNDLVGEDVAGLDTNALFEYYDKVDARVRTPEEASGLLAQQPGPRMTFTVFPAFLADIAIRLNAEHDENAARLKFMRKAVLPLSTRLMNEHVEEDVEETADAADDGSNAQVEVSAKTSSSSPKTSKNVTSSTPHNVSAATPSVSSDLVPVPGISSSSSNSNTRAAAVEDDADIAAGAAALTLAASSSSSSSSSSEIAPLANTGRTASANNINTSTSDGEKYNTTTTATTNPTNNHNIPRYMQSKSAGPIHPSHHTDLPKPLVGGTPMSSGKLKSFIARQQAAEDSRKSKAEERAHALQVAEVNGNGVPEISAGSKKILNKMAVTKQQQQSTSSSTPKSPHYLQDTIETSHHHVEHHSLQNHTHIAADNVGLPHVVPWPSNETVAADAGGGGGTAGTADPTLHIHVTAPHHHTVPVVGGDPAHTPHYLVGTTAIRGVASIDTAAPGAHPSHFHPTANSNNKVVSANPPQAPQAQVGHALYRNAVNKLKRRDALLAETIAEESRLRNGKRASEKSEAMVRRRLAREIAAAVVYIASLRATGHHPPVQGLSTTDGGPEVVPWWLLSLTPGDVGIVLHNTGFLTGTLIPHGAAAHAVRVLCAPGADPWHDPLPLTTEEADEGGVKNGVAKDAEQTSLAGAGFIIHSSTITAVIVDNCRSLARVWHAAVSGSPPPASSSSSSASATASSSDTASSSSSSSPPASTVALLPAVRLLALMQSLVTGAYDARPEALSAASRDIGMDQPLVLSKITAPQPKPPVIQHNTHHQHHHPHHSSAGNLQRGKSVLPSSPTAATSGAEVASTASPSHHPHIGGGSDGSSTTASHSVLSHHVTQLSDGTVLSHRPSVMTRLMSTETHADVHAHHLTGLNDDVSDLSSRAGLLAGVSVRGGHGDMPTVFLSVLQEHSAKLHELQNIMAEKGEDFSETTMVGGGVHGGGSPATAGLRIPIPTLAAEVLGARVLFHGPTLAALKRLYTSRLAYITILSRDDGKRAVAAAASHDVIAALPDDSASQDSEVDPFVRASGGLMLASAAGHRNDHHTQLVHIGGGGVIRQRTHAGNTGTAHLSRQYDEEECTFAPMLCKHSLELAQERESKLMMAVSSRSRGAASPGGGNSHHHGADSNNNNNNNNNISLIPVPREVLMMKYKAEAVARTAELRILKDQAEMAACTFQPNLSASATHNSRSDAYNNNNHNGSSLAGVYVPNYTSLVHTALNSVPGGTVPAGALSDAPWIAKAARLDAVSLSSRSRNEWLFHLAGIRDAAIQHAQEVQQHARDSIEMNECTFKPTTNWGKRIGKNGRNVKKAQSSTTIGNNKKKQPQTKKKGNNTTDAMQEQQQAPLSDAAAKYFGVESSNNITNNSSQQQEQQGADTRNNNNNVDGWLNNNNNSNQSQHQNDDEDDDEDENEDVYGLDNDSVVEVEIPLTVGTDAALVLSRHHVQPHLAARRSSSGDASGGSGAAALSRRDSLARAGTGKATVTVTQRLVNTARGLDGHLRRVLKGRAEREEKRRLDMALSAGVLHKRAVVRDGTGHTVVKPFAFVTEFRALAHGGYIEEEDAPLPPPPQKYVEVPLLLGAAPAPTTTTTTTTSSSTGRQQPGETAPASDISSTMYGMTTGNNDAGRSAPVETIYTPGNNNNTYYTSGVASALGRSAAASEIHSGSSSSSSAIGGGGGGATTTAAASFIGSASSAQTLTYTAGEPPLLYVDVTVSAGSVERIPVWRDSDLASLAAEFASKHGLNKKMARRLEKMIATEADRAGIPLSASGVN